MRTEEVFEEDWGLFSADFPKIPNLFTLMRKEEVFEEEWGLFSADFQKIPTLLYPPDAIHIYIYFYIFNIETSQFTTQLGAKKVIKSHHYHIGHRSVLF